MLPTVAARCGFTGPSPRIILPASLLGQLLLNFFILRLNFPSLSITILSILCLIFMFCTQYFMYTSCSLWNITICNQFNVCVLPRQFVCWISQPQSHGARRWGLWEVIRSWVWSPPEWGHREMQPSVPQRRASPDSDHVDMLTLDFPPPQLWDRNLLFVRYPVYANLLQQVEFIKTMKTPLI